ncbi:spore coat protein D [Desulfosporosinus sp. Sb-LF]|uniref:spore coat protein D n=1 Tax=Desulfosporosinus sp. Sb-LF TaxID=2560027 RepID=UPI00107FCF68|nr:spore coat protein D [Desulfosporosinus sp. Sb-LF]TGE31566.1 spore coat protein D [Desulfosporosinus sp. Sb-LF]
MYGCVKPICCPPEYCVHDYYTQRFVPVIHPIVNINRQNVIDVPQHYYQQTTENVVVNQGFQPQPLPAQGLAGQRVLFRGLRRM